MTDAKSHLTKEQMEVRVRLGRVLFWHTRPEDLQLSDHDLVRAVLGRYQKHRDGYLIDPNE